MLIGTVVVGFMNIGINFTGILAHGVLTGDAASYGGVDNIIPTTIVTVMPTELVGLAIIGPLAASISTISGLLIVASSAIVKDVYLHYKKNRAEVVSDTKIRFLSMAITAIIGVAVFVGDGIFLDVAVWIILEKSQQNGRAFINGRRHNNLLRDASGGIQNFQPSSNYNRNKRFTDFIFNRLILRKVNR